MVRHTTLYAISIAIIFIGLFAFAAVFIRAVYGLVGTTVEDRRLQRRSFLGLQDYVLQAARPTGERKVQAQPLR